jgi:hypothetical protein
MTRMKTLKCKILSNQVDGKQSRKLAQLLAATESTTAPISILFEGSILPPPSVDGSADTKIGRAWMTLLWRLPMKLI